MRVIDLIGQRFGMLAVTGRWPINAEDGTAVWECRCDCGNSKLVRGKNLRRGLSQSCGCQMWPQTHGHAPHASCSKEYTAWKMMRRRCYNERADNFPRYGGRGIRVCDAWRESFQAFLDDVGFAPSPKHSIDRIDVNGNYEPGNVRWATPVEQSRNQRRTAHKEN